MPAIRPPVAVTGIVKQGQIISLNLAEQILDLLIDSFIRRINQGIEDFEVAIFLQGSREILDIMNRCPQGRKAF